jgi:hypothetical protein
MSNFSRAKAITGHYLGDTYARAQYIRFSFQCSTALGDTEFNSKMLLGIPSELVGENPADSI